MNIQTFQDSGDINATSQGQTHDRRLYHEFTRSQEGDEPFTITSGEVKRLELRPNSETAALAHHQGSNKALTSPLKTRTVFKEDNETHMYGLKICLRSLHP